MLTNKDYETKT